MSDEHIVALALAIIAAVRLGLWRRWVQRDTAYLDAEFGVSSVNRPLALAYNWLLVVGLAGLASALVW